MHFCLTQNNLQFTIKRLFQVRIKIFAPKIVIRKILYNCFIINFLYITIIFSENKKLVLKNTNLVLEIFKAFSAKSERFLNRPISLRRNVLGKSTPPPDSGSDGVKLFLLKSNNMQLFSIRLFQYVKLTHITLMESYYRFKRVKNRIKS